ncbi:EAL domain, c-di-GMP-specific phosphodiesterase class I (or its enzymatically inactive variant) [Halopseudomonas xinjiangensis]|uniref:EAL domain, c-di-GMP-specific phosphodiesterase class I (Or its enzymatically inactive variant) n=1 Tax=Halopseudomonas xinjiangensis TaxID=487184 RepID=A0A1H1T899_9GAMM|nr:EAL domain-containing protein [Halopseudomonas xinjiangensis]SDS56363.1 EAL domain, c-di-GMP-specific phosphodiesterase class I (or its enzymatically inactive variant) [Halopseudomonas xinjiangensis]
MNALEGLTETRAFTFAFQPIIDAGAGKVYSHEALVRGPENQSAYSVISRYDSNQMPFFDALCRARAIEVAARIGLQSDLNLNFLPRAAADPFAGLDSTLAAAEQHDFPVDRIIIEATEGEAFGDPARFADVVNEYRRVGMRLAIDDFGAGYAGLNLLAEFQPDIVKLDMGLVRGVDSHGPRQAILRGIVQVCCDLGIELIAEGVETVEEFSWFSDHGVTLFQGYLFAKPAFEAAPDFSIPARQV